MEAGLLQTLPKGPVQIQIIVLILQLFHAGVHHMRDLKLLHTLRAVLKMGEKVPQRALIQIPVQIIIHALSRLETVHPIASQSTCKISQSMLI